MSDTGSYDKKVHRDIQSEMDRLAAQATPGWKKESRTLSCLGLSDGMSILEVGSGPGYVTKQLLASFPNSHVTCLEPDPDMLKNAKHLIGDKDGARVRFIEGSITVADTDTHTDAELAAEQFDVAYARLLFQHLADPVAAAASIHGLLKPGGRLIVNDIDDELFGIFQPAITELSQIIESFGQAQKERGGDRHIGRRLWGILEAAGFSNMDLEMLVSHSGMIGTEPFVAQLDPDRFQSLVDQKLMADQSLADFRASLANFEQSPDAFSMWLSFMVCGQKSR